MGADRQGGQDMGHDKAPIGMLSAGNADGTPFTGGYAGVLMYVFVLTDSFTSALSFSSVTFNDA